MASSTSSNFMPEKYDVFISFRGEDTRDHFTSHLHEALLQKKIETYIDNMLNRGDEISPALKKAIEESKVSVIVFSENYASSTWCLDELVHIIWCKEELGKIVIPIFYNVKPSHVRGQLGTYADALAELEECYLGKIDKVHEWRKALITAANLSGWASMHVSPDSKLVKEIVEDILKKLSRVPIEDFKGFVGMEKRIEKIERMLEVGSRSTRIVGIFGMGGIGKTTLARAVFNRFASRFEGCCFLLNVREESKKHGLPHVQNILYSELLEEDRRSTSYTKKRLHFKMVLVVLDDVNDPEQLEVLVGDGNCFGSGSRIIITTRDEQVLRNIKANEIYKVEELNDDEAVQLFHLAAFQEVSSPKKSYTKLVDIAVNYAGGVPLALKVLGSFLRCQKKEKWETALDKIKKRSSNKLQTILKTSYDELDDSEQSLFLDIACFFIGDERNFVERMLSCDIEVDNLVDKSLIVVSLDNKLWMHDLIQEMGQEIVRKESIKEPGKRSRLWIAEDIYHVLKNNTGTEAVEGICLDMSKTRDINFNPEVFQKMYNLRYLKIYNSPNGNRESNVCPYEDLVYFSDKLVYLQWDGYCSRFLPENFIPDNLVELIMPNSRVDRLWNGNQPLGSLKKMDLSYCTDLAKVPDLSHASNLTTLSLQGCRSLNKFPNLPMNVTSLNLSKTSIKEVPDISHALNLTTLSLLGCYSLNKFQNLPRNITSLNLSTTSIKEVPSSIEYVSCLEIFDLTDCSKLENLPTSICKLKKLQGLYLSGCMTFKNFPEILEPMECLVELELDRTAIRELHSSIENLVGLQSLHLEMCSNLESVPNSIHNIRSLDYVSLWRCTNFKSSPSNELLLCPDWPESSSSLDVETTLMGAWDDFSNIGDESRRYNFFHRVPAGTGLPCSSQEDYHDPMILD
ncbi:hypothetical protein CsatA_007053 [Cannabis sativa]